MNGASRFTPTTTVRRVDSSCGVPLLQRRSAGSICIDRSACAVPSSSCRLMRATPTSRPGRGHRSSVRGRHRRVNRSLTDRSSTTWSQQRRSASPMWTRCPGPSTGVAGGSCPRNGSSGRADRVVSTIACATGPTRAEHPARRRANRGPSLASPPDAPRAPHPPSSEMGDENALRWRVRREFRLLTGAVPATSQTRNRGNARLNRDGEPARLVR